MANLSNSESKKKHKHDLASASSWGHFEKLLSKQAPPPPPTPSPVSPKSPFSFQSLNRLDESCSRLPGSDFHLYGTHPASRAKQLVLCSECGQPVPPSALARHFDTSHTSPPPSPSSPPVPPVPPVPAPAPLSPQEGIDLKPRAPLSLPLQPSYKLNNQTPATKPKQKNPKPPRSKDPPLSPVGPLRPERDSVLKLAAPSKRFPSFLADSGQHAKLAKCIHSCLSLDRGYLSGDQLIQVFGSRMTCDISREFAHLYAKGTRIWVPCPRKVWREGEVVQPVDEGSTLMVRPLDSEEEIRLYITDRSHLPPLKNPEILLGDSDLTSLSYLHEPAVLASLELRFTAYNLIYTWCGIVLIAINPYHELPLYSREVASAYGQLDNGDKMDPHIYAVAEEAHRKMCMEGQDQSIIVTGESGAGKTMSACYVMRYFADLAGPGPAPGSQSLEKRVLACNPLLEAFGNAKTIRNDNSSRFGKFFELCFDAKSGLCGAHLRTYLLEKTRVVRQSSAERNYHVFYQMCAARGNCPILSNLHLSASPAYAYLTGGGTMSHAITRYDSSDMRETLECMQLLGLKRDRITDVFRILAGILHLGNVEIGSSEAEEAVVQLTSRPLLQCAGLWGVPPAGLSQGMLQRQISTARDQVTKSLTHREAVGCRDGLAKFLYSRLFSWLVQTLNQSLEPLSAVRRFIGVLDIYGFETLEINSFEQLCINYANEKLQLVFTEHMFRLEQEEYLRENIRWTYVPFSDNVPALQLLESHLGVLDLLDETCQVPRATDGVYTQKLYSQLGSHPRFQRPKLSSLAFRVLHYAGWVEYQGKGFLEKNTDPVAVDLVSLLSNSSCPLLCELGDCPEVLGSSGAAKGHRRSSFRSVTVASQFRRSLKELVDKLKNTTSHYVRCIKPNDSKEPFKFCPRRVVGQLRACGVLETVKISAGGYPSRLAYSDFFERYAMLVPTRLMNRRDLKQTLSLLLLSLFQDRGKFELGETKVFLRAGAVAFLESLRSHRLETAVVVIQALARGICARKQFNKVKNSALLTQSHARGLLLRRRLTERTDSVGTQYKLFSQFRSRPRDRETFLHSLVRIQASIRRVIVSRGLEISRRSRAAVTLQSYLRGFLERERFLRARAGVVLLQACVRRRIARNQLIRMKAGRRVKRGATLSYGRGMENKIIQLQRRLSAKERENTFLRKRGEEGDSMGPARKGKCPLERSFSVRYPRPRNGRTPEERETDSDALRKDLELERKQRSLELSLHREQVEQLRDAHKREKEELELTHKETLKELEMCRNMLNNLKNDQLTQNGIQRDQLTQNGIQRDQFVREEVSELEMGFEIIEKVPGMDSGKKNQLIRQNSSLEDDLTGSEEETRDRNRNNLRVSSPSGRSSGGIESGIDVSSLTLEHFDGVRSESEQTRVEMENERLWISKFLERFSPQKVSLPLSDLLPLLPADLSSVPGSLRDTGRLRSLLQLVRDLGELRHELLAGGVPRGRSPSCLSSLAIPEGSSVGHRRKSSLSIFSPDSPTPRSRTASSLLTSSLTSSLLGGGNHGLEAELDCVLHQLESLKQANQLLHSELEEVQKERQQETGALQQKIAAMKSMRFGGKSPMEAKLQQEVSRLTQENLGVTSELENAHEHLKQLSMSPAVSLSSLSPAPSLLSLPSLSKLPAPANKRGLLECPKGQEPALLRTLVLEMGPGKTVGLSTGLPAHLLFMALRFADERQDESHVVSLLSGVLKSVRHVVRQARQDLHVLGFWLCNVATLIGDLKQFSGEDAYQVTNSEMQRKECLQYFDLTDFRYLFNDICVGIYHDVTTAIQDRIQHLIVPALLEHQALPTVAMSRPVQTGQSRRSRCASKNSCSLLKEEVTIRDLVRELSLILEVLSDMGVSACLVKQLMRQVFYFINAVALNNILLRKDLCHWSRGLNVRYNISQLEEWTRTHAHLTDARTVDALLPLTQAAQLLQINKKEKDAAEKICGVCADLSPLQIQKLLTMYTPANEFEERVPPSLIRAINQHFNLSFSNRPTPSPSRPHNPKLMQDISMVFPPSFPYAPSSLLLSEVQLPPAWDLDFLKHL